MQRADALLNNGFEWIADGTTDPPKYGAYWLGAFVRAEGDPTDRIVEHVAARGARCLSLRPGDEVGQKIVADPRGTSALVVTAEVSIDADAVLHVVLEDGTGARVEQRVEADNSQAVTRGVGDRAWSPITLPLGEAFVATHGRAPQPRCWLWLTSSGRDGAEVYVDDVHAFVERPTGRVDELSASIEALVEEQLALWFGGSETTSLVDPDTGYVRVAGLHVNTGESFGRERVARLHTAHTLLLEWLERARDRGDDATLRRWRPMLRRFVRALLTTNFDPVTGLPRSAMRDGTPRDQRAVTSPVYITFVARALPLVRDDDPELADACRAALRHAADALLFLQRRHDRPDRENTWSLDRATGELSGSWPNWGGHMPPKLTPKGELDTPRRYNSAWAIVTGRSSWYHLIESPAVVARVHAIVPSPGDVPGVRRALEVFHRNWDAARYDLENDTDDHYGHFMKDALGVVAALGTEAPGALATMRAATDHRLARDAVHHGDTLWIQAVRLGSACAGDSPRAFAGLRGAYELSPDVAPELAGRPLYRDAILELARNDYKGRQLINGQFSESFFQDWEMVCICYRGTEQGDCRDHPAEYWQGDVGDIFGGPPGKSIEAQEHALAVAPPGLAQEFLSALTTIRDVTDADLRRPFGYLAGLAADVARRYELPEHYVTGLANDQPVALGYAVTWLGCLRVLDVLPPTAMCAVSIDAHASACRITVRGAAGATVRVHAWPEREARPHVLGEGDSRAVAGDPAQRGREVVLDDAGTAVVAWPWSADAALVVQAWVLDPAGGPALAVTRPEVARR